MKGKEYPGSHNGDLGECQADSGGALLHAGRAVFTGRKLVKEPPRWTVRSSTMKTGDGVERDLVMLN